MKVRKIKEINIRLEYYQIKNLIHSKTITVNHPCSPAPINISLKDIKLPEIVEIVKQAIQIDKLNKSADPYH